MDSVRPAGEEFRDDLRPLGAQAAAAGSGTSRSINRHIRAESQ